MNVKSILDLKGSDVLTLAPNDTVQSAANVLRQNYIGAVVIVGDDGGIAGILSERDIAVALPDLGAGLGDAPVSQIMTSDVITCSADMMLTQVLDVMVSNGIRHLPVIENGKLKGVISLRDVVSNSLEAISEAPSLDPFGDAA
jgi:CBS domain-containing protein